MINVGGFILPVDEETVTHCAEIANSTAAFLVDRSQMLDVPSQLTFIYAYQVMRVNLDRIIEEYLEQTGQPPEDKIRVRQSIIAFLDNTSRTESRSIGES